MMQIRLIETTTVNEQGLQLERIITPHIEKIEYYLNQIIEYVNYSGGDSDLSHRSINSLLKTYKNDKNFDYFYSSLHSFLIKLLHFKAVKVSNVEVSELNKISNVEVSNLNLYFNELNNSVMIFETCLKSLLSADKELNQRIFIWIYMIKQFLNKIKACISDLKSDLSGLQVINYDH